MMMMMMMMMMTTMMMMMTTMMMMMMMMMMMIMSMTMTKYAGDCWKEHLTSPVLSIRAIAGVFRSHSPMHRTSDLHHHE